MGHILRTTDVSRGNPSKTVRNNFPRTLEINQQVVSIKTIFFYQDNLQHRMLRDGYTCHIPPAVVFHLVFACVLTGSASDLISTEVLRFFLCCIQWGFLKNSLGQIWTLIFVLWVIRTLWMSPSAWTSLEQHVLAKVRMNGELSSCVFTVMA